MLIKVPVDFTEEDSSVNITTWERALLCVTVSQYHSVPSDHRTSDQ